MSTCNFVNMHTHSSRLNKSLKMVRRGIGIAEDMHNTAYWRDLAIGGSMSHEIQNGNHTGEAKKAHVCEIRPSVCELVSL